MIAADQVSRPPQSFFAMEGLHGNHPDIPDQSDADFDSASDVFIALMGVTGSGKSSFISLCCQKAAKVGHELKACGLRSSFPLTCHKLSKL